MIKKYAFKIIKSGNETEIYSYETEQFKKQSSEKTEDEDDCLMTDSKVKELENKTDNQKNVDSEEYRRRQSDIARAKQKIRRLVNANIKQWKYTDKFITLTFAPNEDGTEITREQVIYSFKKFKKRFKYLYKTGFEYIAIIERGTTETERLHIHMIVFNLPYIDQKDLLSIWKYGWLFVNKIKTVKEVTKYITKYIEKTLEDDYIPKGKRFYFTSKGLNKPQESYLTSEEMEAFVSNTSLGECITSCIFESEYIEGSCTYGRYLLNEYIEG